MLLQGLRRLFFEVVAAILNLMLQKYPRPSQVQLQDPSFTTQNAVQLLSRLESRSYRLRGRSYCYLLTYRQKKNEGMFHSVF